MGMFQCGDRQQDADEEHQRAHVDLAQRMHEGEALLVCIFLVAMDEVARQPEHAEPEQDAQERGQVREGLEDRDGHQYAQPQDEHQISLETRRVVFKRRRGG